MRTALVTGVFLQWILTGPQLLAAAPRPGVKVAAPAPQALTSIVPGQWTWASGSKQASGGEVFGVYGTRGVAAPENVPGARSWAVSWTDRSEERRVGKEWRSRWSP